jgi:hypothetical protein
LLQYAELQGASLQRARLQATDLSGAHLWRTNAAVPSTRRAPVAAAVRLSDAPDTWLSFWQESDGKVHPWSDEAYHDLRRTLKAVPAVYLRDDVLVQIRTLDCANSDKKLASCDPSVPPPAEAAAWQKALENARVDEATYAKPLAVELKTLICSGAGGAVHALRGILRPIGALPFRGEA